MDNDSWMRALAPEVPLADKRAAVLRELQFEVSKLDSRERISTALLVERMFPMSCVRGPKGQDARQALFALLVPPVGELKAYAVRGPAKQGRFFGRTQVRPWLWGKLEAAPSGAANVSQSQPDRLTYASLDKLDFNEIEARIVMMSIVHTQQDRDRFYGALRRIVSAPGGISAHELRAVAREALGVDDDDLSDLLG